MFEDIKKDKLAKQEMEMLQEQEKQLKLIGSMKVVPGHIMFCYNRVTKEIKIVKFNEEVQMTIDGNIKRNKKLKVEKDCFYEQALNKKNLIKKLKKCGIADEEVAKELEKTYVSNARSQRDNNNRNQNEDKWRWRN